MLLLPFLQDLSFSDLGRELGERWKALSEEEKKKYQDMAEEVNRKQPTSYNQHCMKKSNIARGNELNYFVIVLCLGS